MLTEFVKKRLIYFEEIFLPFLDGLYFRWSGINSNRSTWNESRGFDRHIWNGDTKNFVEKNYEYQWRYGAKNNCSCCSFWCEPFAKWEKRSERESSITCEHYRNTREKFSRPSTHTRQCENIANDIRRHMHLLYSSTHEKKEHQSTHTHRSLSFSYTSLLLLLKSLLLLLFLV